MRFVKETIGIILIIVFVIFIEIITGKMTNNSLKQINEKLQKVEENQIKENIENLSKTWKNEESKLSCYMEHDELEEISKLINSLEFSFTKNDTEKIEENINEIKFKTEHIKNKQKLKIKNIF